MHWYAVSTKPRQEKQAELHMKQCGIECFLPLLKESKIIRRTKKTVVAPLFPGYVFVRIDLAEQYRAVTYARGVRAIVKFGSKPAEIDVSMIDVIKSKVTSRYLMEKPLVFNCGQVVKIEDGPLGGLEAVFMHEMSGKQRAVLLLQTLAFHARVVVNIDQLSPWLAA